MKYTEFICNNRYKLCKTVSIYLAYFSIGCATNLVGSSLLDLQILAATDTRKISFLVSFRSGGHIFGSIVAGFIGSRFDLLLILCVINFFSGLFTSLVPFMVKFEYMVISILIAGLNYGIGDTMCNSAMASIWKEKCSNFIQMLLACGRIGSLIALVITRPFLLPSQDKEIILDDDLMMVSGNYSMNGSTIYTSKDVRIHYAFLIIGIIGIVASIPFVYFYLNERKERSNVLPEQQEQPIEEENVQNVNLWKIYVTVFMVAIIGHSVYGLEMVVGLLATYFSMESGLNMEKKSAVLLATVFWSCFSFCRLIFIPLTFIISETKLLASSLLISIFGLLITVSWANNNEICIWIGFTLLGIGISPIFGAAYGLLNKYVDTTPGMTSIIFSMGIIGETFHPVIAFNLMVDNMIIFLYYLGVIGLIYIVSFAVMIVYCKILFKPNEQNSNDKRLSIAMDHL